MPLVLGTSHQVSYSAGCAMTRRTSKDDDLESEISRFSSMTDAEIRVALAKLGIDPQPTIEQVKQLVRQRLIAWRRMEKRE